MNRWARDMHVVIKYRAIFKTINKNKKVFSFFVQMYRLLDCEYTTRAHQNVRTRAYRVCLFYTTVAIDCVIRTVSLHLFLSQKLSCREKYKTTSEELKQAFARDTAMTSQMATSHDDSEQSVDANHDADCKHVTRADDMPHDVGEENALISQPTTPNKPLLTSTQHKQLASSNGAKECDANGTASADVSTRNSATKDMPKACCKSYSVCDAEIASVAQLLDVVNDLEKAHMAFDKIEKEHQTQSLHNILE